MIAYLVYVAGGIGILYSLTIVLAAASVWLGRNTSIYDFWFYITTFSRYPMEIYQGRVGNWIRWGFTFVLPILIVVNVPARLLAKPLQPEYWYLAAVRDCGHGCQPCRQPLGFSAGTFELS